MPDAYMATAITQPGFLRKLQERSAFLHALTRDTSFTVANREDLGAPEVTGTQLA